MEQGRISLKAVPEHPAGRLSHLWVLAGHQGTAKPVPGAWGLDFAPTAPLKGILPSPVPPVLESSESSEEQMVAEGSDVTFTCEATGSPAPVVTWLKDGEPLGWQSNQVPGSPRLSLTAVGPADAGVYSCLAANEVGETSKAFHLLVMGACLPPGIWEGQLSEFFGSNEGMSPPASPCALQSHPVSRLHPIPLRCPSPQAPR